MKRDHVAKLVSCVSKITNFCLQSNILANLVKKKIWLEKNGVSRRTRFATLLITLELIYCHKHHLQALVTDKYHISRKLSKSAVGKVYLYALASKFCEEYLLKVMITAKIIRLLVL